MSTPPPRPGAADSNAPTFTSSSSSSSFTFPPEYSFPPFFTRQTNLMTHHAQLTKWAALVLAYCRHHRIFKLSLSGDPTTTTSSETITTTASGNGGSGEAATGPDTTELFYNRRINRRLSLADIREVIDFLRRDGRAEYVTAKGGSAEGGDVAWIYWRTPEEWASLIEGWVDATGQRGSVLTLYELVEGEGTRGSGEYPTDPRAPLPIRRCFCSCVGIRSLTV